jgi:hypothetical protein
MKKTLALFLLSISVSAFSAIPEYAAPKILARANVTDGFNLPALSVLNSPSPVINNRGDVVFKLMAFSEDNIQGLWFKLGSEESGKMIYTAPDMRFVTEPNLNDKGMVAFNLYDEGVTDGIFTMNGETTEVNQVIKPENDDITYYTYPQMLTNGKIYFRGTDQDNARTFYQFDGSLKKIISEGVSAYGQKSSYLFKPSLNDSGAMSFKRRIGDEGQWEESNPDEILLLKPAGNSYESVVIAKDRDSDPKSLFRGFTNSTSISNNGMVAFIAFLDDNTKGLILYKDGVSKNIAREKSDGISEIELFSPKVNNDGMVVFRARDMEGKRGIYLADINGIKKLITEGDEVETDLGTAKILSNPNYPGFGGDVDMNDHGEIVFYCLVVGAKDNKEWGSAIYTLSPQK